MKFLNDDFLLDTPLSKKLFHEYAEKLPIIDYHSHVVPSMIAEDYKFKSITELWLGGDHYKWRLMRNCGIDESLITGKADDFSKFKAFASVMPLFIGNPMYVWCHLELKRYFGFDGALNADNAKEVYDLCNKKLNEQDFSVKNIIKKSNVEILCTTDDPLDDLRYHKKIASDKEFGVRVLPTFRPDKALNIESNSFVTYIKELENASDIEITGILELIRALIIRLDYFTQNGCFISDHALTDYTYAECSDEDADLIMQKRLSGEDVTPAEAEMFKTYLLIALGEEYAKRDMVMQLHVSCLRNPNTVMFEKLGPDTGFDTINSSTQPVKLAKLLDELNKDDLLPKTIVYSLDPNDNRLIESIINAFQGSVPGKIQHGSAWWFNDSRFGMTEHFKALSEDSVLGNFIGMLTDSRSFVSYTRHEYFRRILCKFISSIVENGEYPEYENALKNIVENVSYYNAKRYFGL